MFCPDENDSNRWRSPWRSPIVPDGRHCSVGRSPDARWTADGGTERASCQGWLEGYLLTGRHGLLSSYEAFVHIVDSMLKQHAKWLNVS